MNTESGQGKLYLFNCECVPTASNPRVLEIAGSFVWIAVLAQNEASAIEVAEKALLDIQFTLKRIEETQQYSVTDKEDVPTELRSIAKDAAERPGVAIFDEFLEYESLDEDPWSN